MGCDVKDLKKNLTVNCLVPLARGVDEQIFTGRISDIDSFTLDATKKIITALVLKNGKTLKRWIGQNFSNQVQVGFTANEYGNSLPHTQRYILFSNDAADEAEIDNIAQITDMFSIAKKKGNGAGYKVYGFETGLRMSSLASDSNDETLKGAYVMEFNAPDEKKTPYTFKHSAAVGGADDTATYLETLALALT